MHTIHYSRAAVLGIAALLGIALFAPVAVQAEELALAIAPADETWDETSGYGSVEASRAAPDPYLAPESRVTGDETIDYSLAQANRVSTAQQALLSGDLGSLQEQALAGVVAAGTSWDEASGYGVVEASRAAADIYAVS